MAETHLRSVIKGLTWRLTGTLDTILISYFVTGRTAMALKIGAVELLTKIVLYYLHERAWSTAGWGRTKAAHTGHATEAHQRSLVKGITWRMTGTLDTIVISYLVTGQAGKALSIGGIEVFTKIGLFYLHERAWGMVTWGKRAV